MKTIDIVESKQVYVSSYAVCRNEMTSNIKMCSPVGETWCIQYNYAREIDIGGFTSREAYGVKRR